MERTRNAILIVFAVLLVASMIVFGAIMGTQTNPDLTNNSEAAATVGGEKITIGEVVTQQQNIQRRGQPIPTNTLIDSLIRDKLIKIEAERLGLTASDAEVAERIRQANVSPDGKPFDQELYERNAVNQAGSISAFEDGVRENISAEKVQAFVTSGVSVSEEEVLNDYKRKNTKFNLTYIPISIADIAQTIEPNDGELKTYFTENKKDYYISLPQKKIRYLFLETAKIGEKLDVPDADLKERYDKLPEDAKQAGVNVQEIVLRVSNAEVADQTQGKAADIVQNLRKEGDTISEEKFAEIAKGQSEKPVTAANGGRVEGLVRRATDPEKEDDPYQRVLTMKEGEITEPIEFNSSYYILRRGKAEPKSFEEMKKGLELSARNTKAYSVASELAGKAAEELKKAKDVKQVAEKFASEANMSVDNMIRETGFVKPGDDIDKLGVSQDFEQGIAALENQGDVGEKIPVSGGFAIPYLVDKKAPRDAEFDEVKDKVAEAFKVKQAREKVEEIANRIAAEPNSSSTLAATAKANKLESKEIKEFILGSPLGEGPSATTSEALENAIYNLKTGEVTKKAVKIGDNYFVVGVNEREEASTEEFAKQRDQLLQQSLQGKRGQVFSDYLAAVRERMEKAGEIKIYKEAVTRIDEFNAQTAPPPQPQQPGMPQMPNGQQIPPELMQQIQQQQQEQQQGQ